MSFYLEVQDREYADFSPDQRLSFVVNSAEFDEYGGPAKASVLVSGTTRAIWDLLEWLRYSVVIRTGLTERFWWGYVKTVAISQGGGTIRMSLDDMANKVKVKYSSQSGGDESAGDPTETAWSQDDDSVGEFGTREMIISMDAAASVLATARRDAYLASQKYPQGEFSHENWLISGGAQAWVNNNPNEPAIAELTLAGWWDTLTWRYAGTTDVVGIDNSVWGTWGYIQFGDNVFSKICMQFTTGAAGGTAREVSICVVRSNSDTEPSDNLVAEIYALDGSDHPTGSALAQATVAGNTLREGAPGQNDVVTLQFASSVVLDPSTQYGLVLSRSDSLDDTDYYLVKLDQTESYADGAALMYRENAPTGWITMAATGRKAADMPFILWMDAGVGVGRVALGLIETYADFLTDVFFEEAITYDQSTEFSGTRKLQGELVEALSGAGANTRRVLCWVDWERVLRLYEEPADTTISYYLNRQGRIMNGNRQMIGLGDLHRVPGCYAELVDMIPASVDTTRMVNPNVHYIQSIKWTRSRGVVPCFRGQPSLEDLTIPLWKRY